MCLTGMKKSNRVKLKQEHRDQFEELTALKVKKLNLKDLIISCFCFQLISSPAHSEFSCKSCIERLNHAIQTKNEFIENHNQLENLLIVKDVKPSDTFLEEFKFDQNMTESDKIEDPIHLEVEPNFIEVKQELESLSTCSFCNLEVADLENHIQIHLPNIEEEPTKKFKKRR